VLIGAAAVLGGLLMIPIMMGGTLLLISAGIIGWGVARAVYWATEEQNSSYVRSLALALAGSTVLLAVVIGGGLNAGGLEALALPAAVYGGWIVARQR
jgi:xanthine/uracil permease